MLVPAHFGIHTNIASRIRVDFLNLGIILLDNMSDFVSGRSNNRLGIFRPAA
jgi:hypothetical protein